MSVEQTQQNSGDNRFLEAVERIGNKLPDPAILFVALLFKFRPRYVFLSRQ